MHPIKYNDINQELFVTNIGVQDPPQSHGDIHSAMAQITEAIYQCASDSIMETEVPSQEETQPRWQRIIDSQSEKLLWQAINWKGEITTTPTDAPPDEQFKEHLEELRNPDQLEEVDFSAIHITYRCISSDFRQTN